MCCCCSFDGFFAGCSHGPEREKIGGGEGEGKEGGGVVVGGVEAEKGKLWGGGREARMFLWRIFRALLASSFLVLFCCFVLFWVDGRICQQNLQE